MPRYRRSQPRLKRRTRKAVLNTTSTKKMDSMVTASADGQNVPTFNAESYSLAAPTFFTQNAVPFAPNVFLWQPTARILENGGAEATNQRTSREPYYRGLRECVTVRTNSSIEWQWRRIVFTMKGDTLYSNATPLSSQLPRHARLFRNLSRESGTGNASYPLYQSILNLIFRGIVSVDYSSLFTAKTDQSRVTIMYDKTMNVRSGNANGRIITKKFWHPINKTLVYDDQENGNSFTTTANSVVGKQGMGDMYVLDLIRGNGGATDIWAMQSDATLYWHEK